MTARVVGSTSFVPKMRLKILDELADGGPGQVQRVRCLGERGGFGDANECSNGKYLIHRALGR